MHVRVAQGEALAKARRRLADYWGGPILMRGRAYDLERCDCLIAGDFAGLAAVCRDEAPILELVAINAFEPGKGVGTALLQALPICFGEGMRQIRVGTTNDNLEALSFYQRHGYRLHTLRPGALDASRRLKPSIARVGHAGIPLRDEIDLMLDI
jgi:ribosomal protein S18 acetylase RimI-like enzyme